MLKWRSDDELEILEKLVKKKRISLILTLVALRLLTIKNDSKAIKTFSSSVLRLLKYKTVAENWIKKSLAPFDARNWL